MRPSKGWRRNLDTAFNEEEATVLSRFFTNLDGPVFALVNLPEVVKGALFARYSRSSKSLRRLFIDEFVNEPESAVAAIADQIAGEDGDNSLVALERAEALYGRIFTEYGDDSVAQLGGAHIACEDASNVLTKLLERGRLLSYLEQSTRYIRYDQMTAGRYRFHNPFSEEHELFEVFESHGRRLFGAYSKMFPVIEAAVRDEFPNVGGDPPSVYEPAVKAKVCDALRGLLPAATRSSVGIFGSGQGYEALLLRLFASENAEAREYAKLILEELEKVIPSFVKRVGMPDRGGDWIRYLAARRDAVAATAPVSQDAEIPGDSAVLGGPRVSLTAFDPDGELRIAGAALFVGGTISDAEARAVAAGLSERELDDVFDASVGDRTNRRHRPGREFEAARYRFEVVSDYGAFRDLQRHRMLTVEWQPLGIDLGFTLPDIVVRCEFGAEWTHLMKESASLYREVPLGLSWARPYVVPMAYRIRYVMEMNAREAMHVIELRTTPQGHSEYRRVCLEMHRLIAEVAGHRRVAGAMQFTGEIESTLERLEAERRAAVRRSQT